MGGGGGEPTDAEVGGRHPGGVGEADDQGGLAPGHRVPRATRVSQHGPHGVGLLQGLGGLRKDKPRRLLAVTCGQGGEMMAGGKV